MTIPRLVSTSCGSASSKQKRCRQCKCCKLAICTAEANMDQRRELTKATTISHVTSGPQPPCSASQRSNTNPWQQWSSRVRALAKAPLSDTTRWREVANVKPIRPQTQSSSVQRVELPMARDEEPWERSCSRAWRPRRRRTLQQWQHQQQPSSLARVRVRRPQATIEGVCSRLNCEGGGVRV